MIPVQRYRPRYTGDDPCTNPGCPRPWHGFPVVYVNDYWPFCPGSWSYEQGSTDAQSA